MAYVAGDTILDNEYNNFANDDTGPTNYSYNHIAGTGSGVYGLGQSTLSTVTAGNTITAAQWNSLFTAMTNLANHTNDTLTSTAAVATGDTIAIKAALQSDLNTLAASVAAGSPNATALSDTAATNKDTSSSWTTTETVECTVTAASAEALRFFFNSGGKLKITWSRTTGEAHAKNNEWTDIASRAGQITVKSGDLDSSGSGTITNDYGFHDLTTSYQELYQTDGDTSPYTANKIELSAKDNEDGTMTLRTVFTDGAADTTYHSAEQTDNDYVGTMRMSVVASNPTTGEGLGTAYTVSLS
jgi:hypothetical protein